MDEVTIGDREVTRIGPGTNRLRHTRENVAFTAAIGTTRRGQDRAHGR